MIFSVKAAVRYGASHAPIPLTAHGAPMSVQGRRGEGGLSQIGEDLPWVRRAAAGQLEEFNDLEVLYMCSLGEAWNFSEFKSPPRK